MNGQTVLAAPTLGVKIKASRVQISSRWHTRQATHVMVVKHHWAISQALEVRGINVFATIATQSFAIERVE